MRIPPNSLSDYLKPNVPVPVRTSDYGCFNSAMPYLEAMALAARGEVEAIATRSGKVRYLRLLAEKEKPPRLVIEEVPVEAFTRSRSSAIASTNMGVYRQKIEAVRTDEFGLATREVIGHVWAHWGLREAGI
jgi:hypothetical protein